MKKPHERTYRLNMRRLMAAWYLSFSHALPPLSAGLKVHAFSAYASCGRPRQQNGPGLSGKTKALRRARHSEGLKSEAGAPLGKDPSLGHRNTYVLP